MLIEYTEPRIHIVRGSKGVEFEFRPGAENEVPNDIWEDLQEHSQGTRTLLAKGLLRPVTMRLTKSAASGADKEGHVSDNVPESDKFPARKGGKPKPVKEEVGAPKQVDSIADIDIGGMTSFDAIGFIEKIFSEETLEKFQVDEDKRRGGPRKTVKTALDSQLTMMQTDITQETKKTAG